MTLISDLMQNKNITTRSLTRFLKELKELQKFYCRNCASICNFIRLFNYSFTCGDLKYSYNHLHQVKYYDEKQKQNSY